MPSLSGVPGELAGVASARYTMQAYDPQDDNAGAGGWCLPDALAARLESLLVLLCQS